MYKLAGHLGKTVHELRQTMSYQEFIEWMAYDRLDPIGGYRQDLNTALLAMMQSGDPKAKLSDFILIDPDPISEEMAYEREQQARKEQQEAQKQRLIAMFEGLCAG